MERINDIAPTYAKYLGLMVLVGVVAAFAFMEYNAEENMGLSNGRVLLGTKECNGDTFLPIIPHENTWQLGVRTVLYLFALGYLFLGVAISADTFMAAIEVITSKTTTVNVGGKEVEVEVWNSTVANLTLMALGSSAPEILLAVVETVSLTFEAGELGPGTIVGSAAFNLLFITAICISCLPEVEGDEANLEAREIEEFGVYVITAIASLWAYLWMVIALAWSSKDEVMSWEAWITLVMFPILVVICYGQDQQWWGWFSSAQVSPEGEEGETKGGDGHSHQHVKSITGEDGKKRRPTNLTATSTSVLADADSDAVKMDPEAAAKKAAQDAMKKKKKSRLEYRIQATRKMTGGKRVLPSDKKAAEVPETIVEETVDTTPRISLNFEKANYECEESCCDPKDGKFPEGFPLKVIRSGIVDMPCQVQFDTSDGDAVSGDDYVNAAGTLEFPAGVTEQEIKVKIIDDDEWAPDKHFYARLYGAKVTGTGDTPEIVIGTATTQVTILNDDDPGTISFEAKTFHAMDTKQTVSIPVVRKDGHDGNVLAFVKTVSGTAEANKDYKPLAEDYELHFENKAKSAEIDIDLLHNTENANSTFTVEITGLEPEGAKMGEFTVCTVIITNDKNYQKLMEEVVAMMDDEMGKYGVGTSSWSEQFHDAMNMGGEDGGDPGCGDYVMHFLSFYWKVIHAFIPPTDFGGGWYTFWVSLIFIGVITAFVGDVAKMLGCCIGLHDAITAITFVALGTSLPDTFASVEATTSDDTADAAITNVTGSNSVNVFLGLGLPWVMATLYHESKGTKFLYKSGNLVFSVLVYFVFAFFCIGLLYVRRKFFGGELGGNKKVAYASSALLALSWLLYIVLSAMATEGHIDASSLS